MNREEKGEGVRERGEGAREERGSGGGEEGKKWKRRDGEDGRKGRGGRERRRVDKGKVADKHYPATATQGVSILFRSMSQHLLDT